jgi:hypothetical protein
LHKRKIKGVEYVYKSKMNTLIINNNGVKKNVGISLAKLIAILFVPNPNRCKYVKFLKGGYLNCDYKNLEWTDDSPNSNRKKVMPNNIIKHIQNLDETKLSKTEKIPYISLKNDNWIILQDFLKKDKRYFFSHLKKVWLKYRKNINERLIHEIIENFADKLYNLLKRGFYLPMEGNNRLLNFPQYIKSHLEGEIHNHFRMKSIIK